MAGDSPTLAERRRNAVEAVERLLRIAADHEDADWINGYRQILEALTAESDEEAFLLAQSVASRIPKDPESRLTLQPRWVVSESLAEHVQNTLTRLRTHVRYGDRRPLIVPDSLESDITSRGTRRAAWEAERDRDPEEQKRRRLIQGLWPWLRSHRRDAWRPRCEEGDGSALASKFAGTPWLAPDERWPQCGSCQRPMDLFLQLDLSRLPREVGVKYGGGLLQFFYCRHTGSDADCPGEGFEPFADCQKVRIVQPGNQDVEYPNCPRCGSTMQLLFQHTGDALPFVFGDMGIGHITQCPDHKDVVAFGWACH